ncbi:MAG: hypothetical protein DSO02_02585 [Hadesarchaea archaeon]|nr:MAG: hypothetical protein DSO02_02585 [Hadesarchaea archaeon]
MKPFTLLGKTSFYRKGLDNGIPVGGYATTGMSTKVQGVDKNWPSLSSKNLICPIRGALRWGKERV